MQQQDKEESVYRVSFKQLVAALATFVSTLVIVIISFGGYFVSDIVNTIDVISTDVEFNGVAIGTLTRDSKECAKRQEKFENRFSKHIIGSEDRLDGYLKDISRLQAERESNSGLILECLRIVRER